MNRRSTLAKAAQLIHGDRQTDYGPPHENFTRIAKLWEPIFGISIAPEQVALAMTQLKIARLINTPEHADSWVDATGYLAIGAELATEPHPKPVHIHITAQDTKGTNDPA